MSSFYTLLDVEVGASQQEIEAAYARQQARYHPDQTIGLDDEMRQVAQKRLQELDEAYRVLSNPEQRQQYDARMGIGTQSRSSGRQSGSRERWYTIGGVLVGLVLVVLVWLVAGGQSTGHADVPEVHRPAPDFVLASPEGNDIRLADYRGKVVLVNFWGSWCEPCVREIPALQAAYEQLQDQDFVVIGVNLFDDEQAQNHSREDIRSFVEQLGITYPVALDEDGTTTDAYRVFPIPTSFFIDAQGNIRYVLPRELEQDEIVALFTRLKQETPALQSKER